MLKIPLVLERIRQSLLTLAITAIALPVPLTIAQAQKTIDNFRDAQAFENASPSSSVLESSGSIAGGSRDGQLTVIAGSATGTIQTPVLRKTTSDGFLRLQRLTATDAACLVIDWDANGNPDLFDPQGLQPDLNLTQGGFNALQFDVISTISTVSFRIVAHTSDNKASFYDVSTAEVGVVTLPFDAFTPSGSAGGTDWESVTAIQLITDTTGIRDWRIGPIATALHVLPVELASFNALVDGREAILRWVTASELNNLGFTIEHNQPVDDFATHWQDIAFVPSQGGTNVAGLDPGIHRFRLRQRNSDGSFTLSRLLEVSLDAPDSFGVVAAYPNPFSSSTTISFEIPSETEGRLAVYDVVGREVRVLVDGDLSAKTHSTYFQADGLPNGMYLARLSTQQGSFAHPVIIQK
jgi:hypothetical protein